MADALIEEVALPGSAGKSPSATPVVLEKAASAIQVGQEGASFESDASAAPAYASIHDYEQISLSKRRPELGCALSPKQGPSKRLPEMKVEISHVHDFSILQGVWRTPNNNRASIHRNLLTIIEREEVLNFRIDKPTGERDQCYFSYTRGGLKWELTSFQKIDNTRTLTWQ